MYGRHLVVPEIHLYASNSLPLPFFKVSDGLSQLFVPIIKYVKQVNDKGQRVILVHGSGGARSRGLLW